MGLTAHSRRMNAEVRGEIEQLPRFRLYDTMHDQDKGNRFIRQCFSSTASRTLDRTLSEH